jgi:hypothetical protein
MVDQAFAAAEESIELCQAVSLMFMWRKMEDRSGSLRLGFAVRRVTIQIRLRALACCPGIDNLAASTESLIISDWIFLQNDRFLKTSWRRGYS